MLDFLKVAKISDTTIDYMYNNFSSNDIMSLSDNANECLKIILYLKTLGIIPIEDLLVNETYIFLKLYNRVENTLSKYDILTLVDDINNDYTTIEKYI